MITDAVEKKRILHARHLDPTSGHLGIKKTKRIRERYSWKGINKEVASLVGFNMHSVVHLYLVMKCVLFRFLLVIFVNETHRNWQLEVQNFTLYPFTPLGYMLQLISLGQFLQYQHQATGTS